MIVGNGNIAKILNDREGAIFFASGVSDSETIERNEFLREKQLLLKTINHNSFKRIIYF
jgi:hypothetical protein